MTSIEGFDESVVLELRERARVFIAEEDEKLTQRRRELAVEDAVAEIDGLTPSMLVVLGEASIKSLDDLGDLASDELLEIVSAGALTQGSANTIIMAARAHWFDDEEVASDAAAEGTEADAAEPEAAEMYAAEAEAEKEKTEK